MLEQDWMTSSARGEYERAIESAKRGNLDPLFEFSLGRHRSTPPDVSGKYLRFPEPFNDRVVRESARIKPDLHNQVRRFSSGMTLVEGGRMKLPAQWGSGRG
ncbi:hypothetical protein HKD24_09255 [Gluconobacter sp. LMG 31484]|uniref:Uncharacterized protein n=1 Tax=Gluconobacter vitians TaxID=2728102 RepID=A0ABR9Y6D3_9PROT|nr:hypothetical protein [Gluconobacter vitians]MBF0859400.1 hypothetical protein [Gluconobacter vitians]